MWRPRVDVPEFTRCCFCIPLRYGLLSIAYIKTAVVTLLAVYLTILLLESAHYISGNRMAPPIIIDVLLWIDIVLTITFIFAGHMKNPRIMKIYYYYSFVIMVIVMLGFLAVIVELFLYIGYNTYFAIFYFQDFFAAISVLCLQIYFVLMLRSEVRKLTHSSNFRFVNNQAELVAADKSDTHAILQDGQEHVESGINEGPPHYNVY